MANEVYTFETLYREIARFRSILLDAKRLASGAQGYMEAGLSDPVEALAMGSGADTASKIIRARAYIAFNQAQDLLVALWVDGVTLTSAMTSMPMTWHAGMPSDLIYFLFTATTITAYDAGGVAVDVGFDEVLGVSDKVVLLDSSQLAAGDNNKEYTLDPGVGPTGSVITFPAATFAAPGVVADYGLQIVWSYDAA